MTIFGLPGEVGWLLLGFTLGAVPQYAAGRLLLAWLGKRLGVKPGQVKRFDDATDDE